MKTKSLALIFFLTLITACNETKNNKVNQETKSETFQMKVDKPFTNKERVIGVNLSSYNTNESIELNSDSLVFAFVKASEGMYFTDPMFSMNWNTLKNRNLLKGAYHYYTPKDNPSEQANNFFNTIKSLEDNDLPPVLIVPKPASDIDIDFYESDLLTFLSIVEKKLNKLPIINTNYSFGSMLNNEKLSKYPLWIADYTESENPKIPKLWENKGWWFWSKSEELDIIFNGDMKELNDFKIQNHLTN